MRRELAALPLAVLLAPAVAGQDAERFQFFNACRPVRLVIPAYGIGVEYKKAALDEFGSVNYATTWNSGATGTHGGDANCIVSILSQHLDRFLAAYLRVNEEASNSLAPRP